MYIVICYFTIIYDYTLINWEINLLLYYLYGFQEFSPFGSFTTFLEYSLFVLEYSLFVLEFSLFVLEYSLFVLEFSLFVLEYSLFVLEFSLHESEIGNLVMNFYTVNDLFSASALVNAPYLFLPMTVHNIRIFFYILYVFLLNKLTFLSRLSSLFSSTTIFTGSGYF